jgi:hypothetical protein
LHSPNERYDLSFTGLLDCEADTIRHLCYLRHLASGRDVLKRRLMADNKNPKKQPGENPETQPL